MQPSRFPRAPRLGGVLIVVASVLIASICAIFSVDRVSILPPRIQPRDFETAGAVTHVLVDLDPSGITDPHSEWPYWNRVNTRADLLAHLMASQPLLDAIGRRAHVAGDQIAAVSPITIAVAGPLGEPGSEQRVREILLARKPYRLEVQSRPGSSIIDIYAQAPTLPEAVRLANASVEGTRDYFRAFGPRGGVAASVPLHLRQLGTARGATLTSGIRSKVAALTFLVALAVAYLALRGLMQLRRRRRLSGVIPLPETSNRPPAIATGATVTAAAALDVAPGRWLVPGPTGGALALPPAGIALRTRRVAAGDGNWPHTTRVLPWMLAAFLAMLWLVPFDSIQLNIPTPIDLKLDRLVLPLVGLTWTLALVIGGSRAPRLRLTWIHAAVGAYVVLACLSVIVNASPLSRSLELETPLKKLPLLLSYLSVFVMIASAVRREEVPAFLKFTLALAVVCALGMIWEDEMLNNLFFVWSEKTLPAIFEVAVAQSGWDSVGRRVVHGPTAHPLVAASMLALATPIAVLGVVHARRWGARIGYGLAACVLLLGMLATQRKTGLIAPVAGVVTVAYFRRRELLRLSPVAAVLVIALLIVSPGTVAPVVDQFRPAHLDGANTVSDRASDYDAIRPDVWSHLVLGRGYGSYQPVGHRILDSEVLVRLVEMGVLGLVAFLLLGVAVVAAVRRTIHSRHPSWAPPALAGAASAVVFLVLAMLFDSMSFPQVPYIFLCFAALATAVITPDS